MPDWSWMLTLQQPAVDILGVDREGLVDERGRGRAIPFEQGDPGLRQYPVGKIGPQDESEIERSLGRRKLPHSELRERANVEDFRGPLSARDLGRVGCVERFLEFLSDNQ